MNRSSRPEQDLRRLVTWTGLFLLGAMLAILTALAWVKGFDGEPRGSAVLAKAIVDLAGFAAPLLLGLGLLVIGAMLFLVETELGVKRHLLGLLGAAVGMSVLLGALREGSGGALGDVTGGALASSVGAWLGVPFGLAALLVPLWFAWLRAMLPEGGGATAEKGRALVEWMARSPIRIQPQRNSGGSEPPEERAPEEAPAGVSAPEAQALSAPAVPAERPSRAWVRGREEAPEPEPLPPSPYPEDVRRRGGIPEGAKPLVLDDAERTPARPLQGAAEQGQHPQDRPRAVVAPGEDLAPAVDPQTPAADSGPAAPAPAVEPAPLPQHPPGVRPLVLDVHAQGGPPVPSWEQEELFEEAAEEVTDPADAALEASAGAPEAPIAADVDQELEALEVEAEESAELDEEEDAEEEESPEDEEWDEESAELDEEEDAEEEESAEDEEWDEESAELDEEEDVEEEESAEDEEWDEESAELDEEEDVEEEESTEPAEATVEPADEQPEPVEAHPRAVDPAPEPAPAAPEPATSAAPAPARDDLVFQAGLLFLERGRVAVSLLQRGFGLEFERACEVLDELQDLGLIGPYIGGQQREIRMDQEQWLQVMQDR